MKIEITHHHYHHPDPAPEHKLERLLSVLIKQGEEIMSAISDFAVKQDAFNTKIGSGIDDLGTMISNLNAEISTIQNSSGTVTTEDQATLDRLQAAGQALADKVSGLDKLTPPVVPPVAA